MNDNCLDSGFKKLLHSFPDIFFVQHFYYFSIAINPLSNFKTQFSGNDALKTSCHPVRFGAGTSSQFQNITKALSCN